MSTALPKTFPPIYLLDGGLGTTLADHYGCTFNDTTPLWSSQLLLSDPATLLQAQTAYAQAGADIILSATYQASYAGFAQSGVEAQDAEKAMRIAVRIARDSFEGREGKVALSLGAYGAVMIPSQEYSAKYDDAHVTSGQLRAWHRRRVEVFCTDQESWGEVDFVAFETLPLLAEVFAVRDVMGDILGLGDEKQFWISCVFPGEGNCLPDRSSVREVMKAMLGEREGARTPMGVGINCTKVGKVEGLIEEFEGAVGDLVESGEVQEWPSLVVYPDGTSGEVYNTTTKEWECQEEKRSSVTFHNFVIAKWED
jgi:homocysteine S-methyltransferase